MFNQYKNNKKSIKHEENPFNSNLEKMQKTTQPESIIHYNTNERKQKLTEEKSNENKENMSFPSNFNSKQQKIKNFSKQSKEKKNISITKTTNIKSENKLKKKYSYAESRIPMKPIDYSHVRSKIKDELDYHKELRRQSKKLEKNFQDDKYEPNESNEYDDYRKKFSPTNNEESYNSNGMLLYNNKNETNFNSSANFNNNDQKNKSEQYYEEISSQNKESHKSSFYNENYENYGNYGNYENYEENIERSLPHEEAISSEDHEKNEYNKYSQYNFESNNSDPNKYQLKSEKELFDYYYYDKQDNYNKENLSLQKQTSNLSRNSHSSAKQKLGDIANNFLNSPLMGQLSQVQGRDSLSSEYRSKDLGLIRKKQTSQENFQINQPKNKEIGVILKRKPGFEKNYYSLKNDNLVYSSKNRDLDEQYNKMNQSATNENNYNVMNYNSNNFRSKAVEKDYDLNSSSMSSNFSVFNPNEELKSFFQKEFLNNPNNNSKENEGNQSFNGENSKNSDPELFIKSAKTGFESQKYSPLMNLQNQEYNIRSSETSNEKNEKYAYDYSYLFKKKNY